MKGCPSCAREERKRQAAERKAQHARDRAEQEMARACTIKCVVCLIFYDGRKGYGVGLCSSDCAALFAARHEREDCWPCPFVPAHVRPGPPRRRMIKGLPYRRGPTRDNKNEAWMLAARLRKRRGMKITVKRERHDRFVLWICRAKHVVPRLINGGWGG